MNLSAFSQHLLKHFVFIVNSKRNFCIDIQYRQQGEVIVIIQFSSYAGQIQAEE